MKKNYKYLILFSILFFYGLLMFFYFSNKKKKELFVVVDNYAVFNYDNKKWYNIILNSRNINDYSWKKYNVYLNGNSIGKKILWFDEKWYLFDLKHNPINYSDPLLGIHNTYDYDIKYLNVDDTIVDYSDKNLNKALKLYKIDIDNNYTSLYRKIFDIDNDGIDESIYVVSNSFADDFTAKKYYSLVFMVKNGKFSRLFYNSSDDNYRSCKAYISNIVDLDNDNKYEIFVNCGKYSDGKPIVSILKYKNGGFDTLVTTNK